MSYLEEEEANRLSLLSDTKRMSDRMSTATHRITKPRALTMRTIFEACSFPVCSCSEALAYVVMAGGWRGGGRVGGSAHCLPAGVQTHGRSCGSYNRVKWTAGGASRLHGEDAAALSFLNPLPLPLPLLLLLLRRLPSRLPL